MAQEDFVECPGEGYNTDSWDGYKASRDRVLSGIQRAQTSNPVILTGDVHQHYDNVQAAALRENPWIKYNANRRGYVRIDMDRRRLRADMQILPFVKQPGAPVATGAAFVIEDGEPGLKPA